MQINDQVKSPYTLTFNVIPHIGFKERYIAKNAVILSPYHADRLGFDHDLTTGWDEFGFSIVASDNGDFTQQEFEFSKEQLSTFGGLLLYFNHVTEEEVHRISHNNPSNSDVYGARRVEGKYAGIMAQSIAQAVTVPKLWERPKNPIGFGRAI